MSDSPLEKSKKIILKLKSELAALKLRVINEELNGSLDETIRNLENLIEGLSFHCSVIENNESE